jgi:splicing factor, arginine/serine-rich 4/5/6
MADDGGHSNGDAEASVIGSAAMRPVFLGNLIPNYSTDQVTNMFERPHQLRGMPREFKSIPVDRIDVKRGYCFVFLKDAQSEADKEQVEEFVKAITGM